MREERMIAESSDISTDDGNFLFSRQSGMNAVTITSYSGLQEHVVVPSKITKREPHSIDYLVDQLGEFVFVQKDSVKSVEISEGITRINNFAFSGSNIESISLPKSVTEISSLAFTNCPNLKNITVAKGNEFFSVFENSLIKHYRGRNILVHAPSNVQGLYVVHFDTTDIADGAFQGSQFSEIFIGKTVRTIGTSAFLDCRNLQKISIPDSVISIGDFAFNGCSSLATITKFSKNVVHIPSFAFMNCTALDHVKIPEGVFSIGYEAFKNCMSLTDISFPKTLQSVGSKVFDECFALKEAVFPRKLDYIEPDSFPHPSTKVVQGKEVPAKGNDRNSR
jgi:hypothetical protein